jgi:hypothetical protein
MLHRRRRVQRRGVEHRHGAVGLADQQHDLGAAQDDPLRAALDQPLDHRAVDLARGVQHLAGHQLA